MKQVVMKFGGSSLASLDKIKSVAEIISNKDAEKILVVVSAMGSTTNQLIENSQEFGKVQSPREMDVLMATGEQISIAYLTMALHALNINAVSLTGQQAGILTYGNHSKAKIHSIDTQRIEREFETSRVVVVAGFQGVDNQGDITTLGRGGSDTTAVALAASLSCPVEIYTDVEGIYTIDPRVYSQAKKLDSLSYSETMEMANLGASIIEPRSVELAQKYKIPIHILLNTADRKGTVIKGDTTHMMEENVITNISIMKEIVLINIDHSELQVAKLFNHLAQGGISVDVISQTYQNDISFTILKEDMNKAVQIIESLGECNYHLKDGVSKVSVIGNAMRNQSGVAAQVFGVFQEVDVHFYQVSTSEISISYIIDHVNVEKVVHALAKEFNL